IRSLEKRWMALKRDQDYYIVAVFLNPGIRAHFFDDSKVHSLSRAGLYAVIKRVYQRAFQVEKEEQVPDGLFESYCQYYDGQGRFTRQGFAMDEVRRQFKGQVRSQLSPALLYLCS
ncbi:hypothetical protein EV715DRAFT_215413, partial [Schizophyllum commune]